MSQSEGGLRRTTRAVPSHHVRFLWVAFVHHTICRPTLTTGYRTADSDDEDNLLHDGGKGNKRVVMVQTGMASGESEFEPLNAMEGRPNPYKNHSLPELLARRGYKAPLIGRPVMGQMHVPSDFKVRDYGFLIRPRAPAHSLVSPPSLWHQTYDECCAVSPCPLTSTSKRAACVSRLQVTGETYAEAAQSLQLQWVQGYRGWDTRQNVYYTLGGQVCYHAAAVGICYDKEARTQRFITDDPESEGVAEGNTDDILCMARHPNKVVFATGEIGLRPKIIVWDADTMMQVTSRPPPPKREDLGADGVTVETASGVWI